MWDPTGPQQSLFGGESILVIVVFAATQVPLQERGQAMELRRSRPTESSSLLKEIPEPPLGQAFRKLNC